MKKYIIIIVLIVLIKANYCNSIFAQNAKIDSLFLVLNNSKEDTNKVNLLNKLAGIIRSSCPDSSLSLLYEGLELAEKKEYKRGIAIIFNSIGLVYWVKGDYSLALENIDRSIKYFLEFDDDLGMANCFASIGIIYGNQSKYKHSLENFLKALSLYEKIDDKNGISSCYNNMGIIHKHQKNYSKAIKYYKKSLEIDSILGDRQGMSSCFANIGALFLKLKKIDDALNYINKALIIKTEFGQKEGMAICYNNLGKINCYLRNYNSALENYKKSLKLSEEYGGKKGISSALNNIAELNIKIADSINILTEKQKRYKAAINYSKQSLKIAKEIDVIRIESDCYNNLFTSYYKLGDFEKAFDYQKLYISTKDTLFGIERMKEMEAMEAKFQSEKKQLEIENLEKEKIISNSTIEKQKSENKTQRILIMIFVVSFIIVLVLSLWLNRLLLHKKKANSLLEQQYKQIKQKNEEINTQKNEIQKFATELENSNKTKDRFFSIIAHDLKSPFNTLLGFSDFLRTEINDLDQNEIKSFANKIFESSEMTYKLLVNLLEWSRSQTNKIEYKPTKIEITEIFREIISLDQNQADKKSIKFIFETQEKIYVFADINMVNTIVRNLISNALKYTNDGIIKISFEKISDYCHISVKDNGVGISPENLKNLFQIDKNISTTGTKGETGTGLGLILCKEFVEKNNGEIFVESKENEGSKFTFTLPLFIDNPNSANK